MGFYFRVRQGGLNTLRVELRQRGKFFRWTVDDRTVWPDEHVDVDRAVRHAMQDLRTAHEERERQHDSVFGEYGYEAGAPQAP